MKQCWNIKLAVSEYEEEKMAMLHGAGRSGGSGVVGTRFSPSERGTLIHFYCEEIGKSLERVLQKGGRVITPETKIDAGRQGTFLLFLPIAEGNHIGLYSDK